MLPIAQRYITLNGGNLDTGLKAFAQDLMRGDPSTFKQGYSLDNAVIATAEAFDVTRDHVRDALDA